MAGGRGERFWPLSTKTKPKPFLKLFGDKSLFQMTIERIRSFIPEDHILPVLSEPHRQLAMEQVPGIPIQNYILEPCGKDTAACIGFASLILEKKDQEAIMIALPADHYIPNKLELIDCLKRGLELLSSKKCIVTFGIKPTRAEVGYGYIEAKNEISPNVFQANRFIEKPKLKEAKKYFLRSNYYWNSGIFIWKNKFLQSLLAKHMSEHWLHLKKIREVMGSPKESFVIENEYNKFTRTSIDHGVLVNSSEDILMIPATFQWDDIGNWAALTRFSELDENGNVCVGEITKSATRKSVLYTTEIPLTVVGVTNLVVVYANDRLLICSKKMAPKLKKLLNKYG